MVLPEEIRTNEDLLAALDERRGSREAVAEFDARVWAALGAEGAILVTDLSGFTRITKHHGILHFLSIFRRCQRTCLPLINAHGGRLLKQEADDFIALFDRAEDALAAALAMLEATRALNRTLAEEDRVYMCVGIEHGRLLRLENDAFGDPVNVAYKLGEDIAAPGEILVGERAWAVCRDAVDASRLAGGEARTVRAGNVEIVHYALTLVEGS